PAKFQNVKMRPMTTPRTAAMTMSSVRQRWRPAPERPGDGDAGPAAASAGVLCAVEGVDASADECVMSSAFRSTNGTGDEERSPCAGIIRFRFDGRGLDALLSAWIRQAPVCRPW